MTKIEKSPGSKKSEHVSMQLKEIAGSEKIHGPYSQNDKVFAEDTQSNKQKAMDSTEEDCHKDIEKTEYISELVSSSDAGRDKSLGMKKKSREWEIIKKSMETRNEKSKEFFVVNFLGADILKLKQSSVKSSETEEPEHRKSELEYAKKEPVKCGEDQGIVPENVILAKDNQDKSDARTEQYLPRYRTGAYSILKVLSKEDGITRSQICFRGNKYSDVEFNSRMRYSAWSSMKILISKGMVFAEGRPVQYYITERGRAASQKLPDVASPIKTSNREVVLLIDSREMKNKRTRSFFQKELSNRGVNIETTSLEVGDFLWMKEESVLNYVVERKYGADFASSIAYTPP